MPNTKFIIVENCLRNNMGTKPDGNDDDIFVHSSCNMYTMLHIHADCSRKHIKSLYVCSQCGKTVITCGTTIDGNT